jgi:hypothetical protein
MINRTKKTTTNIVLKTTAYMRLGSKRHSRRKINVEPITKLLFDMPNIIALSIIGTFLEL